MVSWDNGAFSLRLMRMLKLRGMSFGGACVKAGIERGGKYRWLEGTAQPRADTVVRLARVLDCSPGWLLFGDQAGAIASDQQLSDHMLVARIPTPRMKGEPLIWKGPVP